VVGAKINTRMQDKIIIERWFINPSSVAKLKYLLMIV
jgi:hypothetical protein